MDVLRRGTDFLKQQGHSNARRVARLLLAAVLKCDADYLVASLPALTTAQEKEYQTLLERAAKGEPITRILGEREFWSLPFYLSPATLDPRPDSETLVHTVLNATKGREKESCHILDLGTGSGCLLLSLLHTLPYAQGVGVDISYEALETAQKNAMRLRLEDRVRFQQANWCQGIEEVFDIVISNPPYIKSGDFEALDDNVKFYDPQTALVAGIDGLDCYRAIATDIRRLLRPEGLLALEIGQGQEKSVRQIFQTLTYVTTVEDLAGIPRVLLFKCP